MDLHFRIQTPEGKAEPATFPSELSVQQLISEFVTDENMRIQPADPALWYLLDENTGGQLDPNKSLQQNGVQAGHILKLIQCRLHIGLQLFARLHMLTTQRVPGVDRQHRLHLQVLAPAQKFQQSQPIR